jgi:toxin ParE1/3/4
MSVVHQRHAARRDLVEIVAYLAERSEAAARRFRTEAETTFTRLAGMPGMGTQYEPDEPAYAELRYFPVSKFPRYLVFYRSLPDGIEVVRVLHGSRDIAGVLADDFGIQGEEGEADV